MQSPLMDLSTILPSNRRIENGGLGQLRFSINYIEEPDHLLNLTRNMLNIRSKCQGIEQPSSSNSYVGSLRVLRLEKNRA
jgi:hypothetical protein